MKKILIAVAGVLLALSLTGCDVETVDELEKRAEYAQACRDKGGSIQRQGIFRELDRCVFP